MITSSANGKERKFVISKVKEEYALIESTGVLNLTEDMLKNLIEKCFFKTV